MSLEDFPHIEQAHIRLTQAAELLEKERDHAGTWDGRDELQLALIFTDKAMERLSQAVKAEERE